MAAYLAHRIEETGAEQTMLDHLNGTASLAGAFGAAFGVQEQAHLIGQYHDIGKYSRDFQGYLASGGRRARVDHSTAGMQAFWGQHNIPAAFCVGGHHAGLPNLGRSADGESGNTLHAKKNRKNIPDYQAYMLENPPVPVADISWIEKSLLTAEEKGFAWMFYIRMLYSCLVDADYLDTEKFMQSGQVERRGFATLPVLKKRFDSYINKFSNPQNKINEKRWKLLQQCLRAGDNSSTALQNLTIPTGGGKTIASLGFALHAAVKNDKVRIIYVIPYTSIIEQTAEVFRGIVGKENVLEHHMNVDYEVPEGEERPDLLRKRLATENWDAPIIVTTNVQFFESLFANRSSKCRKLHNIVNSILIFDEAQMLPIPFLRPCTQAIWELTAHYGCKAVLCTATQPSLDSYFHAGHVSEICPDLEENYDFFRRTTLIPPQAPLEIEELADCLSEEEQVLCIVNTKKHANVLFEALKERCESGVYYLSTNLCAVDRSRILAKVRKIVQEHKNTVKKRPCRLIATSLVEAGVDLDFPTVYRELAGLDSVLQAAGRCNREGINPREESFVHIFILADTYKSRQMQLERQIMDELLGNEEFCTHLEQPKTIRQYFAKLHQYKTDAFLDFKDIMGMSEDGTLPFADIAEAFRLIDTPQTPIYIPKAENEDLTKRLKAGERSRSLLREASKYMVNVYSGTAQSPYERLLAARKTERIDEMLTILTDLSLYDEEAGLMQNIEEGQGIMF